MILQPNLPVFHPESKKKKSKAPLDLRHRQRDMTLEASVRRGRDTWRRRRVQVLATTPVAQTALKIESPSRSQERRFWKDAPMLKVDEC